MNNTTMQKKSTLNTDILDQINAIQVWTKAIVHQLYHATPDQMVMDRCQRRIDEAKQDILSLVAGEIK